MAEKEREDTKKKPRSSWGSIYLPTYLHYLNVNSMSINWRKSGLRYWNMKKMKYVQAVEEEKKVTLLKVRKKLYNNFVSSHNHNQSQ